jgi:phosphatidylinositol alpha-1,6-mannosyltransferase
MAVTGVFQLGGGIAAANRLVYWALKDAGYEVDILALNETTSTATHGDIRQSAFSNSKFRFTIAVWQALLSHRYTCVFCDHVNLAAILLPLRLIVQQPLIVRLNGVEVFTPYPSFEGRLGLRAANHLTAISEFTRTKVIDQFPQLTVTTIDLSLSPTASDLSISSTADRSELRFESIDGVEQPILSRCILIVGRMASSERYKGQDVLIRAMEEIVAIHPMAQLVLVGRGDDYDWLRQIALSQPVHVRGRIFMPGFVEDAVLQQLYQRSYVFAMPSRGEGFGLVYLEAMRWSRACLGSHMDAAATIIVDGETGVLVSDPTNPRQVAASIIELMDKPEAVEQMGRNGYERLNQQYLFEHFSRRFINWVEQSIGQSSKKKRTS